MSIQNTDFFHAAARVGYSAPGTPAYFAQRGFAGAVVDNGPGDFTLTLEQGVDASARVVAVTPTSGGTYATATVQDVSDNEIRIRTFDAAGAALDNVEVAITVLRFNQ